MAKALADELAQTKDSDLVIRCQQGDRNAFRLLYRKYQQKVRSTLYQLCGEQMLDDLTQDVFLRAWKGLPKLREASHFSTWIYRITWNVAQDRRRQFAQNFWLKVGHQSKSSDPESFVDDDQLLSNTLSRPQDTPDWMQIHYQDLIHKGLETLSFDHRAVIVLHDLEDMPQKEVATILNLPLGTVKSRLFHARSAMRKFLQQQGVEL
jgi:RNA polymerase sigma-70 factor, ECF subfamily